MLNFRGKLFLIKMQNLIETLDLIVSRDQPSEADLRDVFTGNILLTYFFNIYFQIFFIFEKLRINAFHIMHYSYLLNFGLIKDKEIILIFLVSCGFMLEK